MRSSQTATSLVAGGNKDSLSSGIVQTHIFDWRGALEPRTDMAAGRWYPSVAALGNDEAVIVGGGPAYLRSTKPTALRRLTSAAVQRSGYPSWCHARMARWSWWVR